ncbi:hypothetical protein HYH03_004627 [Edaphochlamys debaryana]|uniref:Uncharacterized protein n=1 Tax=Edaphochlamys debaryana TaxID=47281 RepID=A0A836C363_9CHLO|nr:hypothetical protein HYH03_004627 [Edaphochlamys debaryana]|eukprot:KAG2497473.1 hypothetical protein HYH03_004627 [Edaphochlamys debaryana]
MEAIEKLLQRGQDAQGGGVGSAVLSAHEAEHIIQQLQPLGIDEIGSTKWYQQHSWIEQLNMQAHHCAQTHSDEFVVELLVSLDRLHVLIHELLAMEAWMANAYPLLKEHLAASVDSASVYMLLYHQVVLANLLQIALHHAHASESLSEDYALELADWCSRCLVRLVAEGQALAEPRERTAEEIMAQTSLEAQEEQRRELDFGLLMCSLNILRSVTDALPRLPMGALGRMVSTNDTLMALLPLLDRPPWARTRTPPGGGRPVLEKWVGNGWRAVPPQDRLKITTTDGQVWLAVTNLLVEPRCRAKYCLDEFRRERLLGLKRHLNDLMFDQLPVLKDLQRVLDEMALGVAPDQAQAKAGALILEAVPVVREAMLRGRNWRALAAEARERHFGEAARRGALERALMMAKNLDFLCELEPRAEANGAAEAGPGAGQPLPPVRVATWRKVHDSGGGVHESWYDFSMDVDEQRPPEPVEVADASFSGSGLGAAVQGLRYRLRPLDFESTRPLPANGKAVVRWGGLSAEALLSLPELPTRDSGEGAAVLWVTVGLLAVDGLALQIKLKKAPKPKERDRVAGVWYAYHPVAGALTVRKDLAAAAAAGGASAEAAGAGGGAGPATASARTPASSSGAGAKAAAGAAGAGKLGVAGKEAAAGGAKADAGAGAKGRAGRPLVQVLSDEPAAAAGPAAEAAGASAWGPSEPATSPAAKPQPKTVTPETVEEPAQPTRVVSEAAATASAPAQAPSARTPEPVATPAQASRAVAEPTAAKATPAVAEPAAAEEDAPGLDDPE